MEQQNKHIGGAEARLAEYEETDLTPMEVKEMQKKMKEANKHSSVIAWAVCLICGEKKCEDWKCPFYKKRYEYLGMDDS